MVTVVLKGGGETSSLNEELAAQLPSGDNVFSKPFGDFTTFQTDKGLVKVTFMFDPKKSYAPGHKMASVTSDYLTEMRRGLMEQLLDAELIAPRKKTCRETIWDLYTSRIPKETLAKRVFTDDAKLAEFMDILKTTAEDTYRESEALTEAISGTDFKYAYEIAIDAYPSGPGLNKKRLPLGHRSGVLTFYIEGVLSKPEVEAPQAEAEADVAMAAPAPKTKAAAKGEASPSSSSSSSSASSSSSSSKSNTERKKRKRGGGDDVSLETEAYNKLYTKLAIAEKRNIARVKSKKFPLTAIMFFEQVGRWFSTVVAAVQTKQEAASKNKSNMYH